MNVKEINIPISWGHIAGKTWGNESDSPVIVLHGYQDNAGSFDNLIPLLPQTFFYICIDLPGHGRSLSIPTHTFVSFLDYVYTLKHVADYFNRQKYILLGHSYGGQTSIMFSLIFPEYVTKLVCLDTLHYFPIPAKRWIPELREIFRRQERFHKFGTKSAPTYTLEDAIQRMRESRWSELSEEGAKTIMQRSLVSQADGKYKISTAQNLKFVLRAPLSLDYHLQLLQKYPISCPHLVIGANGSQAYRDVVQKSFDELRTNKLCQFIVVEGEHDVHVDHPERVSPLVSAFLLKQTNKL